MADEAQQHLVGSTSEPFVERRQNRTLSDADIDAIVCRLKSTFIHDLKIDIGNGVLKTVRSVIVALFLAAAVYLAAKGQRQ